MYVSLVYSEKFLQFKGHAPRPRLGSALVFLLELLKRNNDSEPTLLTVPLPSLLRCLMVVNEPQGEITLGDFPHRITAYTFCFLSRKVFWFECPGVAQKLFRSVTLFH